MSSNQSSETLDSVAARLPPGKVCLVLPTLARPGGAERVGVVLATEWIRAGRAVTILTTDSPDQPHFFDLPADVEVRHLSLMGESRGLLESMLRNVRRIALMRREILRVRPVTVISFIDVLNVTAVFACLGTGIPVIAAERTSPAHAPIGRLWRFLRNVAYRVADRVVVQSEGAYRYFERPLGARLALIPNPVPSVLCADRPATGTRVIAIGRFTAEKGFDLLIRSFAAVAAAFPEWSLTIFGDGPLRGALEQLVIERGMKGRVFLPGVTKNSSESLAQADLFVLSSHFEGFPNALCEAMAAGVACIATDCPDGPRDIVRNGLDGILVPPGDLDALSRALAGLMGSPDERRRLGRNAREGIGRFSIERVMGEWDRLLAGVQRQRGKS